MVRLLALAAFLLVLGSPVDAAPRMSIGGGGLSYTCDSGGGAPETATCTCTGWFDCRTMVGDGVCKRKIDRCWVPAGGGGESCSCQWKTSIAPKAGRAAPQLEMRSQ
jgi:hypothetical protein